MCGIEDVYVYIYGCRVWGWEISSKGKKIDLAHAPTKWATYLDVKVAYKKGDLYNYAFRNREKGLTVGIALPCLEGGLPVTEQTGLKLTNTASYGECSVVSSDLSDFHRCAGRFDDLIEKSISQSIKQSITSSSPKFSENKPIDHNWWKRKKGKKGQGRKVIASNRREWKG